jgi:hypothetical protein
MIGIRLWQYRRRGMGLTEAYPFCWSISKFHIIGVVRAKTEHVRDVDRSNRSRFVLQAKEICRECLAINLELRALGKCNVLNAYTAPSAND